MGIKLNKTLIIDIEATCWESKEAKPKDEVNEIIEIGICPFDNVAWTSLKSESRSIIVKPIQSRVSAYCTELTTLTQADVDAGISLQEACNLLTSEYNSKSSVWASWGDYDREMFLTDCRRKDIPYPFSLTHFNLKAWYGISRGANKGVGMTKALTQLHIPLEGTHHRGVDDACNIARILELMTIREGV